MKELILKFDEEKQVVGIVLSGENNLVWVDSWEIDNEELNTLTLKEFLKSSFMYFEENKGE